MGCKKLTYQNFNFLEVIHPKKRVSAEKKRIKDYVGNYVYENNVLKQFSQPEGYVEPNGSSWQYVYRYTDIWGNTRITYADDNNDGVITASSEIRREQNFYPFGLEHKGYNNVITGVKNNLKTYQGQEFTDDLGLNTHEWKYRISDPAIGRFWQIDPLAEKYTYNSTYAFQENKMGMGIELEGAETLTWLQQKMTMNAIENPTGISAKVLNTLNNLVNNTEIVVSKGVGAGFKVGKFGVEVDFGSQEIATISSEGVKQGDENSTTNGYSLAYLFGEASVSETSTTESKDVGITYTNGKESATLPGNLNVKTKVNEGGVSFMGFGTSTSKTTINKTLTTSNGVPISNTTGGSRKTSATYEAGKAVNNLVKTSRLSIYLGVRIELKKSLE